MWVLFASLNPFAEAFRGVFSKRASKRVDSLLVSWFNNFIPLIFFSPVIFIEELKFNHEFFLAVFISGTINIIAVLLYHRAISKGDISVVVPMMSFTPLFLLIMSPLIVGEFPDAPGVAGIILIVIGSYLLNINLKKRSIFEPFKALLKEKSTRYMLIVSFIWSISANYDKIGITSSSTYQYIFFVNLFISTGVTIILLFKKKFSVAAIKLEWKNLLPVGLLTCLAFILHMTALSLTYVAYVVALKRMSGMISVFLGYFFLREGNISKRLLGSTIMFVGVLFIVLF